MKLVIFSDIHGNAYALEAFLQHAVIHSDDLVIFCGDIVGYYYDLEKCAELMQGINNLIAVRGNHDQYYINAFYNEELTKYLAAKYGASYRTKSRKMLGFLENLPVQKELNINDYKILIQHGSLENLLEGRIYPDSEIYSRMKNTIHICGHTHYQMFRQNDSNIWINPGSLGQPRDKKGFSYCVFDITKLETKFYIIEVDVTNLIFQIESNDPDNPYLKNVLSRNARI